MKSFFIQSFKSFGLFAVIGGLILLSSCGDDPEKENIKENISTATLTFTPVGGGTVETVTASDPDLDGPLELEVDGAIELTKGITYNLSVTLINELAKPTDEEYDVTAEVEAEGDEHQFFFEWTGSVFSSPTLSGNVYDIGNPTKALSTINYLAPNDVNGRPIGLNTQWTTAASAANGTFRIVLTHLPDGAKTSTSNSSSGDSDVDIVFDLEIK